MSSIYSDEELEKADRKYHEKKEEGEYNYRVRSFAEAIKLYKEEYDLKYTTIADMLGITKGYLSKLIHKRQMPGDELLEKYKQLPGIEKVRYK